MGSCIAAAPSLITKPSTSPVLITCSMQKWRKKAWGISSRDLQHDCQNNVVTPPLNSQVTYETDLAFCASYKDGTSASRELHQAYEAYPG